MFFHFDALAGILASFEMPWTTEQVLALAPDASSAKAGKNLSAARKWKTRGATDVCAWGTIQGSGSAPYQTSIDFSGPAFKCTCPSRKFPCKHGLGLFLILAQQPAAMTEKAPPSWTTEWLSKRVEKEEKKAAKLAAPETPGRSRNRRPYGWIVRDESGHCLLLNVPETKAWTLLALSGGRPIALAGEWDGAPMFDQNHAAAFAALGIPAFACTPDLFPDLMAAAIQRHDITRWITTQGITTSRAKG